MTKWTEQTEGARAHNATQAEEAARRDAELLAAFETSGESMRAFARGRGISVQRLSVRLQRARAARDAS